MSLAPSGGSAPMAAARQNASRRIVTARATRVTDTGAERSSSSP